MDVPRFGGGGDYRHDDGDDEGEGLSLEADDEAIIEAMERQARRRARSPESPLAEDDDEENEEQKALLRQTVLTSLGQMRELKRTKPGSGLSLEERLRGQRVMPGVDIRLEISIVRHVVISMEVPAALKLGSALRSVRELLWTEDHLWKHWWLRDFREVAADRGGNTELPSWIVSNRWKDLLAADDPRLEATPALRMYAKMPWRCWYAWSEFFRRSALWHIARIANEKAHDWVAKNHIGERHADWARRPPNVEREGRRIVAIELRVPSFSAHLSIGIGRPPFPVPLVRGSYLASRDLKHVCFPVQLYWGEERRSYWPRTEVEHWYTRAVSHHPRSPVYWLAQILRQEANLMNLGNLAFYWDKEFAKRGLSNSFSVGGRDASVMNRGPREGLNFAYVNIMLQYGTWYVLENKLATDPDLANVRREHDLRERELRDSVPAIPKVAGVWFVGRPLCVGCDAGVESTIRCTHCGQGYCGRKCHAQNWEKNCAGCKRK